MSSNTRLSEMSVPLPELQRGGGWPNSPKDRPNNSSPISSSSRSREQLVSSVSSQSLPKSGASRDPPSENDKDVILRVYDLSKGAAAFWSQFLMKKSIEGVWHTAVNVFNLEFYYGGQIEYLSPKVVEEASGLTPKKELFLGRTKKRRREFKMFLDGIEKSFQPESYNLTDWNCNHFTDVCARFLLDGRGIPKEYVIFTNRIKESIIGKLILSLVRTVNEGANPFKVFLEEGGPESPKIRKAAATVVGPNSQSDRRTPTHQERVRDDDDENENAKTSNHSSSWRLNSAAAQNRSPRTKPAGARDAAARDGAAMVQRSPSSHLAPRTKLARASAGPVSVGLTGSHYRHQSSRHARETREEVVVSPPVAPAAAVSPHFKSQFYTPSPFADSRSSAWPPNRRYMQSQTFQYGRDASSSSSSPEEKKVGRRSSGNDGMSNRSCKCQTDDDEDHLVFEDDPADIRRHNQPTVPLSRTSAIRKSPQSEFALNVWPPPRQSPLGPPSSPIMSQQTPLGVSPLVAHSSLRNPTMTTMTTAPLPQSAVSYGFVDFGRSRLAPRPIVREAEMRQQPAQLGWGGAPTVTIPESLSSFIQQNDERLKSLNATLAPLSASSMHGGGGGDRDRDTTTTHYCEQKQLKK